MSVKKYPSIIKPYILLAEILRKERNFNDAIKTLFAAKKIEKSNSDIYYNLSITYRAFKSFKDALLSIDFAIKLQPKNQIYKILKADILTESFQNEEAKELLTNLKLPKDQQDRDMIARELLIKFQMSSNHPLVTLKKAYKKN